jgi:hypothetical protein
MMNMAFPIGKNKQIQFICEYDQFPPVPSKKLIPDWYKNGEQSFIDGAGNEVSGMKRCVPFLDIMTAGYMILLGEDAIVKIENGIPKIENRIVFERDSRMGATIVRPNGYLPNNFVWHNPWAWQTPKGWSTVVTHPYNRFDLPFITLSGFMESDTFVLGGSLPFYLKEGFEGIIPAGTPIAQIIPVKRANWVSRTLNKEIVFDGTYTGKNHYKKHFWKKKQYD